MLKGSELGTAIAVAIDKKKEKGIPFSRAALARHFKIKASSVTEWIKFGRISKEKIPELVAVFADVVGPEHWGLPAHWRHDFDPAESHGRVASVLRSDEMYLLELYNGLASKDEKAEAVELISAFSRGDRQMADHGKFLAESFSAAGIDFDSWLDEMDPKARADTAENVFSILDPEFERRRRERRLKQRRSSKPPDKKAK